MNVKILFIFSRSIGGWISCSISITSTFSFRVYCVFLIPLLCCFMWTLSVTGDISRIYLSTAVVVRTGHVVNWLFLMALMSVCFGRTEKTLMEVSDEALF